MKTVLIAVLSCKHQPYTGMISVAQDTWDSVNVAGVETFYYTGAPMGNNLPRVISFPIDEALSTIGHRDIEAFKWALQKPWDFLARVNASCYVRKQRLLEHIQTLPERGLFQGVGAPDTAGGLFLWGGAQWIMSRDVIEAIVANASQWDHSIMEDNAISRLAKKIGITLNTEGMCCSINWQPNGWLCITYGGGKQGGFEFKDLSEMSRASEHFFIRVKQDGRRPLETTIMQTLRRSGL